MLQPEVSGNATGLALRAHHIDWESSAFALRHWESSGGATTSERESEELASAASSCPGVLILVSSSVA